jgi:murein DD-endopeptidase MepM/ murein hydrolase activator NlpD
LAGPHSIERSYPYGSTQDGKREIHHGVEFYNPQGTPVLAAAAGDVVFAGDDKLTLIAWVTGFYGNVIVLEHSLGGETFFTLYGHLYKIDVTVGQRVVAGEQIGAVGASGTAIGSHLHFEIRRGANDYFATRNPELWLAPPDGTGVLAGWIVDGRGSLVKGLVNMQRMENGTFNPLSVGSAATYAPTGVNGDDVLQETFALGEIPAGEYRLSLVHYGIVYEQVVKIEAGRLTFVNFLVK